MSKKLEKKGVKGYIFKSAGIYSFRLAVLYSNNLW